MKHAICILPLLVSIGCTTSQSILQDTLETLVQGEQAEREEAFQSLTQAPPWVADNLKPLMALDGERGYPLVAVVTSLGEGDTVPLDLLADHYARAGKSQKAEEAMRLVAKHLNHAPGSEPYKTLLYRIAGFHDRSGDRRGARRVYLEIYTLDPSFRDVNGRLEALSQDVASAGLDRPDERVIELVDVGAPLGTIFDAMQALDLTLDAKQLAQR